MKKVTINFIMSMVVVVLMLAIVVFLEIVSGNKSHKYNSSKNEISATSQQEEISDVEGYGKIVNGIGDAFKSIVIFILKVLLSVYAVLLFVFATVARAVFSKQENSLRTYRILMGIEYILQGGFVYCCVNICINVMSVPLMILGALVAAVTVYGSINTYTDRILD